MIKYIEKYIDSVEGQTVGAVEYTDYIDAEDWNAPNVWPGYDIKPSDDETQVQEIRRKLSKL